MADKKVLANMDFGGSSSIKNLPYAAPAENDSLAIMDYSDGGKVKRGPSVGTNDGKFLRHDGTWQTPPSGGMYVHRIQIKVTSTITLYVKITTSRSTPYSYIEDFENMVAGHTHVLYNTSAGTYKPIFVIYFSGEYGSFEYIDIMNGNFRSPSQYYDLQPGVVRDDVWQA